MNFDSDFFYFTGFSEPDALMILAPGRPEGEFILLVRPKDPLKEIWDGHMEGLIGAKRNFDANQSYKIEDLIAVLTDIFPNRQKIFYTLGNQNDYDKKVIFIRGVMEDVQTKETQGNLTIYNFLTGEELENAFNQSETVLSRSGYTTLMDLAKLKKKAFFIPTPGQTEQVYLAKRLQEKGIAPSCKQHQFSLKKLEEIELYKGLSFDSSVFEWRDMFSLF